MPPAIAEQEIDYVRDRDDRGDAWVSWRNRPLQEETSCLLESAHVVNATRSLLIDLTAGEDPRPEDWAALFPPIVRYGDAKFGDEPQRELIPHAIPSSPLDRLGEVADVIKGWMKHFHAVLTLSPYAHAGDFGLSPMVPVPGAAAAVVHELFLEASSRHKVGRCLECGVTWRVSRGYPNQRCEWCLGAARTKRHRERKGHA